MRILEERRKRMLKRMRENAECGNDEESTKSYVDPNA